MVVRESFYRGEELGRETRTLPWQTYNLAHTLLKRSEGFILKPHLECHCRFIFCPLFSWIVKYKIHYFMKL